MELQHGISTKTAEVKLARLRAGVQTMKDQPRATLDRYDGKILSRHLQDADYALIALVISAVLPFEALDFYAAALGQNSQ